MTPMIIDAHAHLFSRGYYAGLWRQKHGREPSDNELAAAIAPLGLALPPADPAEHAARWAQEMDRAGIDRMVLFTSLLGEQSMVAAAVKALPDRFLGYTMVNPRAPGALETAERDLTELGLSGMEFFPAMHRFSPSDESLMYPFYELAAKHKAPVFCHVGLLRIRLREILGLPSPFDMSMGDPMRLHRAAADHPGVNFIIPHFGCGYLREAAFLGQLCRNVFVDTSSSNDWLRLLPEKPGLARALEICLEAFGSERILFGTDSSVFPRGYRVDILRNLQEACDAIGVAQDARARIMGGNLAKLLGIQT